MNKRILTGIVWTLFTGFAITMIISGMVSSIALGWLAALLMTLVVLILVFAASSGAFALFKLTARVNYWLLVALGCGFGVAYLFFDNGLLAALMVFAAIAVSCALIGGGIQKLRKGRAETKKSHRILAVLSLVLGVCALAGGLTWLLYPGKPAEMPKYAAISAQNLPPVLEMENPGEPGSFQTGYLTYGSGEDKHREAFGAGATLITQPVDGSAFLDAWKGLSGKMRTRYFGFDQKKLPLNGRVWYPQGEGPFPLVLIVHGNHMAQDFSDPGYEYLGKLLASRGYILVSVDENFLNSSIYDVIKGLNGENDARGWLLLKHLQVWKEWNLKEDNPFFGKVDMDRIALIGHSRGGESVAHAALFNRLPYYPDKATEVFDFNFNIRSIIAIAPCDGQYQPGRMRTPLTDINYLVLQGSHDADVSSYQGMRQFNRVRFSEGFDGFVAGIYIWNANHGQFNSVWGNSDFSAPRINFYNLGQLLSPEDQMTISKIYISAFLDVTLKDQKELKKMFMDHRCARNWLPETVYLSQYREPGVNYLGTFAEDLDLTTGTLPGSKICATDLSIWREQALQLGWGDADTRALTLGWNTTENDTTQCDTIQCDTLVPFWQISWPDDALNNGERTAGFAATTTGHTISAAGSATSAAEPSALAYPVLTFSLAAADEKADPPGKEDEETNEETEEETSEETGKENVKDADKETGDKSESDKDKDKIDDDEDKEEELIDFTIRLTDRNGAILEFPLSDFSPVQPVLKRQLTKLAFIQKQSKSETILQYCYFPLERYAATHPDFDFTNITSLGFVFNITPQGVIIINNLGISSNPSL